MELMLAIGINLGSQRIIIIQSHSCQIWRLLLVKFIIITIQIRIQPKVETTQPKTKTPKKAQTLAHKRVYLYYQTMKIIIPILITAEIKLIQKPINYKNKSMLISVSTHRW